MLGDLERHLLGHLPDRPLEVAILEWLHAAASPADRMVMMMPAGVDSLIAGYPTSGLEALHQA